MTIRKSALLLLLTTLVLVLLAYTPSGASDDNRVAVVVDFGNGQVAKRCVSFAEEQITGYEALERSGLPVETDFQSGGAAVCRIDGQGCPANDCFCACRGGDGCNYWSYWHLSNGAWSYSSGGASIYQLRDGAVDGWVWGLGSVTQASPPPLVTFSEICTDVASSTPTITVTSTPSSTPVILPTAVPEDSNPVMTPTATLLSTVAAGTPVTTTLALTSPAITQTETISPALPATTEAAAAAQSLALSTRPPAPPAGSPPQSGDTGQPPSGEEEVESAIPQPQNPVATPDRPRDDLPQPGTAQPGAAAIDPRESPLVVIPHQPAPPTALASTLTPMAIAAVIGQNATIPNLPAVEADQNLKPTLDWISYAGFAGLLVILGAFGFIAYHRRRGWGDGQR